MTKNILALTLVLIIAISLSSISFAQSKQKESQKEQKTEMTKAKTENSPVMTVSCGPECGFSCSSRNEKELISIVKSHVKNIHKKSISDKDVKGMIKTNG
jgi:predicted small metal-binding protein